MILTKHDAWLDIYNVRRGDLLKLLVDAERNNSLGVDIDKIKHIREQLVLDLDAIEGQVLIAQKKQLMEDGKV